MNTAAPATSPQSTRAAIRTAALVVCLAACGLSGSFAKGAAATLAGEVISIADGDTLTILDRSARTTHKIRLAYIDAPEKSQAFGNRAKQALSAVCFGKQAQVAVVDTDKFGRSVGLVSCQGVAANSKMVADGFAWVYRKFAPKQSELFALETKARLDRVGLWADTNPTPPWDFRRFNDKAG
jgi:endonuclease YncB( thermonuclease family)